MGWDEIQIGEMIARPPHFTCSFDSDSAGNDETHSQSAPRLFLMMIMQVRYTWIGEREINNPMMFVSVPRHLRYATLGTSTVPDQALRGK